MTPKHKFKEIADVFKICEQTHAPYSFKGSTWYTIDGQLLTGSEQHRGKRVLIEERANGKTYQHWWYKQTEVQS